MRAQVPGKVAEFTGYGILYGLVACGFKGAHAAGARQALCAHVAGLAQQHQHDAAAAAPPPAPARGGPRPFPPGAAPQGGKGKAGKARPHRQPARQEEEEVEPGGAGRWETSPEVAHALEVVQAFRLGDWTAFLGLYARAPRNMTPWLMDHLLPHVRRSGLQVRGAEVSAEAVVAMMRPAVRGRKRLLPLVLCAPAGAGAGAPPHAAGAGRGAGAAGL